MTLAVFTFVMCIGVMFKANDLLARGVPWQPIVRIVYCGIPQILSFSIPISVMITCLLVFGRLSSDGEIIAMKSCGISLVRVITTPLLISFWLCVFCMYINNRLAPEGHYLMKSMRRQLGFEAPMELLEVGRFTELAGMTMYVGSKKDGLLKDIRIYDMTAGNVKRQVKADSGVIRADTNKTDMIIELYDGRIDPFPGGEGVGFFEKWTIEKKGILDKKEYTKRESDFYISEILAQIKQNKLSNDLSREDAAVKRMALLVELNKRIVLSVACFVFAILGIPLGIKTHRRESSIGVSAGLLLFFMFYLFIIIGENLAKRPGFYPHLIVWFPAVVSAVTGAYLVRRVN